MNEQQRNARDAVLKRAMCVQDLIEKLETCDPDAIVVFVCSYGDHRSTQQALLVSKMEDRHERDFDTTAYSRSGIALRPDVEEWHPEDFPGSPVVVLSM